VSAFGHKLFAHDRLRLAPASPGAFFLPSPASTLCYHYHVRHSELLESVATARELRVTVPWVPELYPPGAERTICLSDSGQSLWCACRQRDIVRVDQRRGVVVYDVLRVEQ